MQLNQRLEDSETGQVWFQLSSCWGEILVGASGANIDAALRIDRLQDASSSFFDLVFHIGGGGEAVATLLALHDDGHSITAFWLGLAAYNASRADLMLALAGTYWDKQVQVIHMIGSPIHRPELAGIEFAGRSTKQVPSLVAC